MITPIYAVTILFTIVAVPLGLGPRAIVTWTHGEPQILKLNQSLTNVILEPNRLRLPSVLTTFLLLMAAT
ncbi:MAG: hypothetical protein R3B74_17195 [Nitrospirales bacterium]|nr:hypothetical protein [Nitrospirales bacterium]